MLFSAIKNILISRTPKTNQTDMKLQKSLDSKIYEMK